MTGLRYPALALAVAACGSSADPEPAPAPALPAPVQVFRDACLDAMPDFAATGGALDAAGIANATGADGTLVGQAPGLGVLVIATETADGAPASGCLVGTAGAAGTFTAPLRAVVVARAGGATETPVSAGGLAGIRWSWAEHGRDITAELFDDPAAGQAKMLLTVPHDAG